VASNMFGDSYIDKLEEHLLGLLLDDEGNTKAYILCVVVLDLEAEQGLADCIPFLMGLVLRDESELLVPVVMDSMPTL
jgi:hypothetical protein